jgi:hypothetical protein
MKSIRLPSSRVGAGKMPLQPAVYSNAASLTQGAQTAIRGTQRRWRTFASHTLALLAVLLSSSAFAQTATTRSKQTIYTNFSISAYENGSSTLTKYGDVKFDVEVSEPYPGRIEPRVLPVRHTALRANTTFLVAKPGNGEIPGYVCGHEFQNGQEQLRCSYKVIVKVNSQIKNYKTATAWKTGGGGSIGFTLPKGVEFNIEGEGEKSGSVEYNFDASLRFERSFTFVVQLRDPCNRYPAYSVYTQGGGSYPKIYNARCLYSPPSPPDYCGTGWVHQKNANGTITGKWQFESETHPWKTLTNRTYRFYDNDNWTDMTYTKTCAVNLSSCHVFESYDWYNQFKRMNFSSVESSPGSGWCSWYADEFAWDYEGRGGYTIYKGRNLMGGCGCPGSNHGGGRDPVFVPSPNY